MFKKVLQKAGLKKVLVITGSSTLLHDSGVYLLQTYVANESSMRYSVTISYFANRNVQNGSKAFVSIAVFTASRFDHLYTLLCVFYLNDIEKR